MRQLKGAQKPIHFFIRENYFKDSPILHIMQLKFEKESKDDKRSDPKLLQAIL